METPNQEKVWDGISSKWNEFRVKPIREVLNFLKNKKGRLLDVGCGSGRNFVKEEGLKIYGVDFSTKQLSYAEKRASEMKIDFELKKMNNEAVDYSNDFFDCIICSRVLHCVESKEKRDRMIAEIFRVLKKNSEAYFTTWGKDHKRLREKNKECFIPWKMDDESFERYTYIYDLEELEEDLKKIGFSVVESFERDGNNFVRVRK